MLFFAIDDEPKMLQLLHESIATAEPCAEIMDFENEDELLSAIIKQNKKPDVVFMDIEFRGSDGILLAVKIRDAVPEVKIVFVTGNTQRAVDAYQIHANGYIIKPADPDRIREELNYLNLTESEYEPKEKLCVRCFGNFEVFWHGEPLVFRRAKSKELFAYLVDREGAFCTGGEIISALWEDCKNINKSRNYLRILTHDLVETFESVGMKKVLVRGHDKWAIRRELLDCDYYRMLDGDVDVVNAYCGEYMAQYTWGEMTAGKLYFRNNK